LLGAAHPVPALAVSAMITALAWQAAGLSWPLLAAAGAALAGQLSIGWSNDAVDAERDASLGRTDKPIVTGMIGVRAVWAAALGALASTLLLAALAGPRTAAINAVMMAAGWTYNLGLKATPASGLMYVIGFGLVPAFAASVAAGSPAPGAAVSAAAALLGLGGHFANALPDLAGDRRTGVAGLPQRVAARWGERAAALTATTLLLAASALLVVAAERRAVALLGLLAAGTIAVFGARGTGRVLFRSAIAIAATDVLVLLVAGVALT
jgi:4-hydroxybenzoate polyprenyltransferase